MHITWVAIAIYVSYIRMLLVASYLYSYPISKLHKACYLAPLCMIKLALTSHIATLQQANYSSAKLGSKIF